MYKKILVGFLVFSLLTTMLASCAIYDEASLPQGPQAHMAGASFLVSSVKVPKGQMLTLVDDSTAQHIIKNDSDLHNPNQMRYLAVRMRFMQTRYLV